MVAFECGYLVATRGVSDMMQKNFEFYQFVSHCIARHRKCDWGELCEEDKHINDDAVEGVDVRILSSYPCDGHPDWKVWIITEADRSYTTILFPDEY